MLHEHERWIQFHRLLIKTSPSRAPEFVLGDLLPHLKARVDNGDAIKLLRKETASIRIAQMDYSPGCDYVRFLLQYADTKATDPVFMDLESCELRTAHKLEGEGVAVSGHVVLRTAQDPDGTYSFLVEDVPGFGRTLLQSFFRSEFKAIAEGRFTFEDEANNNRIKPYRPMVEILDEPSASFVDDLDSGTIDGVELIKRTPVGSGDFDEPNYFEEDVTIVKVRPIRRHNILQALDALRQKASQKGFGDLKVRYTKPAGKHRTATMGTRIRDLQSAYVVRTEMIESDATLPQCADEIEMDFTDKIVALL